MDIRNIIQEIDVQIAQLSQARDLLSGSVTRRKPDSPKPGGSKPGSTASAATSFNPEEFDKRPRKRRTMSPETRVKMAEAQRLRWAKKKKTATNAATQPAATSTDPVSKRATKKRPGPARKTAGAKKITPKPAANDSPGA